MIDQLKPNRRTVIGQILDSFECAIRRDDIRAGKQGIVTDAGNLRRFNATIQIINNHTNFVHRLISYR